MTNKQANVLHSPAENLYGMAEAVARKYRGGNGTPLPAWIDDAVVHDAVHEAYAYALQAMPQCAGEQWEADDSQHYAGVSSNPPESLGIDNEFCARVVGGAKSILRNWAASPGRYCGNARTSAPAELFEREDASDALADYREVQEEATATVAGLEPIHRDTILAMIGKLPKPPVDAATWRKRQQRAREAVAEVMENRFRRPSPAPVTADDIRYTLEECAHALIFEA